MKSVTTLQITDIVDIAEIEAALGGGVLTTETKYSDELINSEFTTYEQALDLAVAFLNRQGRLKKGFPPEFFDMRNHRGFSQALTAYLLKTYKIALPPGQIAFYLTDQNDFLVAKVHLADTINYRWVLSDIILQREVPAPIPNLLHAAHAGLGGGIFDRIMDRVTDCANRSDVNELCLMAFHKAHRELFEKRGFTLIPPTHIPREMLDLSEKMKIGYPMWKKLRR